MKLVSFNKGDQIGVGVVQGNNVIDISYEYSDMLSIIEGNEEALNNIKEQLLLRKKVYPLQEDDLVAPIPEAKRNIICVGWNYLKHFNERTQQDIQLPNHPNVFTKATETITGPNSDIPISDKITKEFDYEAELAVIIGKGGSDISEKDALDHVFGYTVANDMSARDLQHSRGGQWFLGKSINNSCPIGPWIVTKDELSDPQSLEIKCTVNGNVVQSSNTSLMIFSIKQIISDISSIMKLLPGDIILTGTPEGIGAKRNPPLFLFPGDTVEVEIEEIGKIKNKVVKTQKLKEINIVNI